MGSFGGGSGGVLGPSGGVSGTFFVALGGHGVSGFVCGVSGVLVGMAGGCTVGGRLGGYLSLGGAGGVGSWAGAAVSVVGGALLGAAQGLGLELLALVLGPKETGGPVGAAAAGPWTGLRWWARGDTGRAWTGSSRWERGYPGAGTAGYWIGTGKGWLGGWGLGG